jgi:hypothetical protein
MEGVLRPRSRGVRRIRQQSTKLDGARLIHTIAPMRREVWDDIALWLAARHLIRVLAAVLKVHPEVDQANFLIVAARVIEAETRLADVITTTNPEGPTPTPRDAT